MPLPRVARLTALSATILLLVGLAAVLPPAELASSLCPAGYRLVDARELREEFRPGVFAEGGEEGRERVEEGEEGPEEPVCIPSKHPEPLAEIAGMHAQRAARVTAPFTALPEGVFRAALAERDALRAAGPDVPGSAGMWEPYGRGPLIANDERYEEVNRLGLVHLAGRVDSLDYDPASGRVFALVGTGGVWLSEDHAQTWRSIGDRLPTQINGALGWTPAGGGTLAVVSGEHTMGGNAYNGLGAFWTNDLGATWHQASGVPDGALGFQVAVDPTDPDVVYVATSKGLYRSTDAGRTYTNAVLPTRDPTGDPTRDCAGRTDDQRCIFANYVTDVVVQGPDSFGNRGGEVLAAVGFRGGGASTRWPNGEAYAPYNGLYHSPTGEPGSFAKLPAPGFTPQERIGRIELGVAEGAAQNHDYVYAIVQDAVLLAGGIGTIDAPEDVKGPPQLRFNTTLNGVYVSADFGQTWTLMADETTISESPLTGSGLIGLGQVLTFAPGIQSWFNLFIKPDPTRQTQDGIPTRLTFGLEEVWQNRFTDQPQDGPSDFKVIGRYLAGESCILLPVYTPVCPTNDPPTRSTTTHPDQHDAIHIPDRAGGAMLVVGNDGGIYRQHVAPGQEFTNTRWGAGDNEGFNTLLAYHAVMAKDGTVWFGLQDNGTVKIEPPSRKQFQTVGGDGLFVAVDPDDSKVAYSETPRGSMRVTIDGGQTWGAIPPPITNAQFSNPFVMDPEDSDHLMTAGREVVETIAGPDTQRLAPSGWMRVFDLGTRNHPGEVTAIESEEDPANSMSALDLHGDAAYVGFCGYCDLLDHTDVGFRRGLATNVGGDRAPRRMTANGWHVAAAKGLPNRWISSIAIDPADPTTVYVTLGGYGPTAGGRQWVPPGSYLDANREIGRGHVFKSVDAGETFVDISGNLPDAPVNWVLLRGDQLLVATEVAPFISRDTQGSDWAVLGTGLPNVPVSTLELAPHDPDLIVAAAYGRGVWTYRFHTSTSMASQTAVPLPSAGEPQRQPLKAAAEVLAAVALIADGPADAVCAAAVHLSPQTSRLERALGCPRSQPSPDPD